MCIILKWGIAYVIDCAYILSHSHILKSHSERVETLLYGIEIEVVEASWLPTKEQS